ncbi:MAG: hypothetical protein AB7H93_25545 [Vicinamibacterales bacterium]
MRLDSPRAIGLVGSGLVLAGWMLGSTLSPPVARTQSRAATPPVATADDALAIVPLRALGSRVPRTPPPAPTRNPFTFGVAAQSAATAPAADSAALPVADGPAPSSGEDRAAAESWRLIGMATSADGTHTAVLGRAGTVVLARLGDLLPGGATVTALRGDAVQLTGADGTVWDVRLP